MPECSEQLELCVSSSRTDGEYHLENGVSVRDRPEVHENERYYADSYGLQHEMQRRHFCDPAPQSMTHLPERAVGARCRSCGGWTTYLSEAGLSPDGQLSLVQVSVGTSRSACSAGLP